MSKVIIIGGGVTGLCSAYYLHKSGWEVVVIDKGDMLHGCSYVNAGMIVPSHFAPVTNPSALKQAVRWIFNAESPLQIRPSLTAGWLRWGSIFMRKANNTHVKRAAIPLRDISVLSSALYSDLDADLNIGLENKGILILSRTEESAHEEQKAAKQAAELGLDVATISREETIKLQGGITLDIAGAVHYKCDAHLHPGTLMKRLIGYLESSGVRILPDTEIKSIKYRGSHIDHLELYNGEGISADNYVLAAGAWSAPLARDLGVHIPLMPGRGYSFTVPEPSIHIPVPCLLSEGRVAVTPFGDSIRFGGTMEFGNMGAPVNLQKIKGIVHSTNKYFPDLKLQMPAASEISYGYRPCSPDGLPYIGTCSKADNLVVATGHGMLGVSLGPATGLLVTELLSGKKTSMNVRAFSPDRFK